MENKGLLFIPDISGYTRLVNGMEVEHSKLIIQELLELLINANEIGLEISEIEGDAILFYKYGEPPPPSEMYRQVEKMFVEFHKNLLAYGHRRYCQCKGCISASDLTLKIITHYGEFTGYSVKNFNKLIGKDVIIAHELLKNDIGLNEYWLITNNLLEDSSRFTFTEWMQWASGRKITQTGEIPFHYTQLSRLKEGLKPKPFPLPDLSSRTKLFSLSREYDTDIITMFHASGDFANRSKWMEGVKKVEEVRHYLPRVGMKCCCVMKDGSKMIYSSSYSYSPERIEFSETDESNNTIVYYTLEKLDLNRTSLTIDIYIPMNGISKNNNHPVEKNETEAIYRRSMQNLVEALKYVE
jgi:hypothetical protein